jgi:hypothetical protein
MMKPTIEYGEWERISSKEFEHLLSNEGSPQRARTEEFKSWENADDLIFKTPKTTIRKSSGSQKRRRQRQTS